MIPLPQAHGVFSGFPTVPVYAGTKVGPSTAASQSVTTVPIGTASAFRRVYILCVFFAAAGTVALNSATIGGVTATMFTSFPSSSTTVPGCRAFAAVVPTGTTATVALTFSGTLLNAPTLFVWSVATQREPLATVESDNASGNIGGGLSATLAMNPVVNGGFLLSAIALATANVMSITNAVVAIGSSVDRNAATDANIDAGISTSLSYVWSWSVSSASGRAFGYAFKP